MEIKGWAAKRGYTQTTLAAAMGVGQVWISRRIGNQQSSSPLTLDDTQRFADVLRVPILVLLEDTEPWARANGSEELPRLDSNQKPAG